MKFKLSGNLLRFSHFRNEIDVVADTIERGIIQLTHQIPSLRPVLLDGQGAVRAVHRVFFNGEMLGRNDLTRAASGNDEVSILTAIAGG